MAVALAADMALLALAVVALAVGPLHDAGRAPAVPAPVPPAVPATLQHNDCLLSDGGASLSAVRPLLLLN